MCDLREVIQTSMKADHHHLSGALEQIVQSCSTTDTPLADLVDILKDEIKCAVCLDLPIEACMTGCKHVFCKFCLDMTRLEMQKCPMCRARFAVNPKRIEALDEIIKTVCTYTYELFILQSTTGRKTGVFNNLMVVPWCK